MVVYGRHLKKKIPQDITAASGVRVRYIRWRFDKNKRDHAVLIERPIGVVVCRLPG